MLAVKVTSMTDTYCCEYSTKTPVDRQQVCPKHVEFYIKINLRNSASCWLPLYEYITMHGPQNVIFKLNSFSTSSCSYRKLYPYSVNCGAVTGVMIFFDTGNNWIYRVIHKYLRDFRTRLRNNQERQGRKEHINRSRISPSFFFCTRGLGVLPGSTARGQS